MGSVQHCAFCVAKRLAAYGSFEGMAGLNRVVTHVNNMPVCGEHVFQAIAVQDLKAVYEQASFVVEHWQPTGNGMGLVPIGMLQRLSRACAAFDDGRVSTPAVAGGGS